MSVPLTFAFVDLAGYTALTDVHGDEDAANCAARFYEMARCALQGDTRVVKRIGDAVMLVSASCGDCVASVLKLFGDAGSVAEFPGLRAGIFCGQAVERDGDYFGAAVNLAARISAHARADEVLCGESVAAAVANDAELRVLPLGAVAFKNVAHPVAVFSIKQKEAPPSLGLVDPVCKMRIAEPRVTLVHGSCTYSFCSDACAERFREAPESFT